MKQSYEPFGFLQLLDLQASGPIRRQKQRSSTKGATWKHPNHCVPLLQAPSMSTATHVPGAAATLCPAASPSLRVFICLPLSSPPAGSTISPSPCSLQPGFLLHPARFTLLFPPPLPLPHSSQAMFAFLSPAVFPLPPPGARSPLHPPQEAAS